MVASGFSIIQIALLIHYEATDGRHGDGFMLPLPVISWLFLVLPLCILATILTIVSCARDGYTRLVLPSVCLIVLAAVMLPIVLAWTLSIHARFP